MSITTPRILPEHLHAFLPSPTNRTPNPVRILGTVAKLHGETATLSCPGGQHAAEVTLVLNRDSHLRVGRMVDVVGKVAEVEGGRGDKKGKTIEVLGKPALMAYVTLIEVFGAWMV
ncbi:hypothetical protein PRK78_006529 [Emydomyces testavorans]|uniref:Replication factor A protein 3 n=1 Tax=Emydomyces testavorans TaxID=2070801 RepID=A0AAF0DQE1_9EURO|nr:hypothetical protein PRK78_006529 [Emydomyces testavorans]